MMRYLVSYPPAGVWFLLTLHVCHVEISCLFLFCFLTRLTHEISHVWFLILHALCVDALYITV